MPRVQLESMNGQTFQMDTLDIGKIGPWLEEWIPRLGSPDASLIGIYPRLTIYPLWDPGTNEPDLPGGSTSHMLDLESAEELCKTIRKLARVIAP